MNAAFWLALVAVFAGAGTAIYAGTRAKKGGK